MVRPEPFDPVLLFEELVLATQPLAVAKGLRFGGTLDPSLQEIVNDEQKIHRVATNLLTNAVKYCVSGHVLLDFRSVDDDCWKISVTDTGEGIPREHQDQIFREFHRLPGAWKSPGAGLGLAITKQLVELLGGTISIHSEVGMGSVFSVTLPKKVAA
jgi:signal transduction histidine kinase